MATLKGLLIQRNTAVPVEENLEKGYIWSWTPGSDFTNFCNGICWTAPSNGAALIEIWGAGGSGSRMCCCSATISGNSGAYARKEITVASGCYICGHAGKSCRNGGSNGERTTWFDCSTT